MAHKKGVGSSKNGRESHSKRLGVKIYGGQLAVAGNIIVRHHTLHAAVSGIVKFQKKKNNKSFVSIEPLAEA